MNTLPARQSKTEITTSAQAPLSKEQKDLLKRTICAKGTDDEFSLFVSQCNRSGLDPFTGQIYAIFRYDAAQRREVMKAQVGISGLQLIAERTGKFQGCEGPWWCGKDGKWVEIWLADELPAAAMVKVHKDGYKVPTAGKVLWKEFAQTNKDGKLSGLWGKMPVNQLGKCAKAQALREAFPQELSGFYIPEEIRSEIQGDLVEQSAEKKAEPKPPWLSPVPDPAMVGYESEIIPDRVLPAELRNQGVTLAMLVLEENHSWKRKGGEGATGYDLVEYWSKTSGHEMHPAAIAALLLYADIEEPEKGKAAPSEPPAPVTAGMEKK